MTPIIGTLILSCIFGFAGILSILASVLNWNWFFNTRNSQIYIGNSSRKKARIIYFVLGCLITAMAIFTARPLFID